ncbi:MAG TPA: hypothetical protein VJQ77_02615 [Novosphingobium sp.]|nr:hypothetical protein [Novosphingobium sp.]
MADETVNDGRRDDASASHTTVIHERGSSGTGIIIAVVLLLAVIAGIYLFTQRSSTEAAKDNAITNAANSVSNAADKAGNAAEDAANNADNASGN